MNVPRKYAVLRVIALILKILAWVVLALGLIGMIVAATSLSKDPAFRPMAGMGTIGVLLVAVVWFVQLFALGSVLSLLIDIEENTRALASNPPE
jgi:hypothetical protein